MNNRSLLFLPLVPLFAVAVQAGEVYTSYAEAPSSNYGGNPEVWRFFVGGNGGYLLDNEETYGAFHAGMKVGQSGAVNHSVYLEGAYAEFSDSVVIGDFDFDTKAEAWLWSVNYQAEVPISGALSWYGGAGLGIGFVNASAELGTADRRVDEDTTELFLQAKTGLAYDFTSSLEGFGGARFIWLDDFDDVGVELGARVKF